MDKVVTVFDVESFIVEVKRRPSIWDCSSPDYSDKVKKQQSWREICLVVRNDYDQLDKEAKLAIANDLHRKWKNLRQCFRRELDKRKNDKSRTGRNGKSTYAYYDLLSFLVPVMANKKIVSTIEEDDEEGATQCEDNRDTVPSFPLQSTYFASRKRKLENDHNAELYGAMKQTIAERTVPTDDDDDDKHFLLSLLKPMRCISPHLKFNLRTEIIQVVGRYYNASLSQHPFPGPTPSNFPTTSYFPNTFSHSQKFVPLHRHPPPLHPHHMQQAGANSINLSSPSSSDESVLDFSDI